MAATAAAKRAPRPRTVAPKATTPTEVPVITKPSIWTRIKTTAQKTAAVVAKPFKAVAAKIKPATEVVVTKTKSATKRVAQVAKSVVAKVSPFVSKFWKRALKPLLVSVAGGLALFGLVFGAIVAPFTTALCLVLAAGLSFLLAGAVEKALTYEDTRRYGRLARIALWVIDAIGIVGMVLVYTASAAVVALLMLGSWTFTAFVATFLTLSYLQVRGAASIAFVTWSVLSGNWTLALLWTLLFVTRIPARAAAVDAVPEYSEIRRKPETHDHVVRLAKERLRKGMSVRPSDAPNNPELWTRGNHLVAKGTEEMWGTEHDRAVDAVTGEDVDTNWAEVWVNEQPCTACGSKDGSMRVATDGPVATHGLCSTCFELQCEEDALKFTGVSLKQRSIEIHLNQAGIQHSKEYTASKFDATSFHWLETMWWRDRGGTEYVREKICLVDGQEVARVVHDHKRKVYRASVLGQLVRSGVKTSWELAQRVAQDELSDERAAVLRHEAAAEEVVGETLVRLQPKKV